MSKGVSQKGGGIESLAATHSDGCILLGGASWVRFEDVDRKIAKKDWSLTDQ
jgi:hypothetical protein